MPKRTDWEAKRTDWEAKARGLIRAEIARQNVTYSQLVERLESIGVVSQRTITTFATRSAVANSQPPSFSNA